MPSCTSSAAASAATRFSRSISSVSVSLTPSLYGRRTRSAWRTGPGWRSCPARARRTGSRAPSSAPGPAHPRRSPRSTSNDPRPNPTPGPRSRRAWGFEQRLGGQVEQPGADHASAPPDLGDLDRVEVVLVVLGSLQRGVFGVVLHDVLADVGDLQDVESLGVRGHDPILDPVVDHLHEVAGAVRAAVEEARLGGLLVPGRPGVRGAASTPGARVRKIGSRRCTTALWPPIIMQ